MWLHCGAHSKCSLSVSIYNTPPCRWQSHPALGRDIKCVPMSQGGSPTHTVTGKILLAAVMVMQVLNTTCSQWPCSTQSSEFQDKGRVKVMFISSWASRPTNKNVKIQREHLIVKKLTQRPKTVSFSKLLSHVNHTKLLLGSPATMSTIYKHVTYISRLF